MLYNHIHECTAMEYQHDWDPDYNDNDFPLGVHDHCLDDSSVMYGYEERDL